MPLSIWKIPSVDRGVNKILCVPSAAFDGFASVRAVVFVGSSVCFIRVLCVLPGEDGAAGGGAATESVTLRVDKEMVMGSLEGVSGGCGVGCGDGG